MKAEATSRLVTERQDTGRPKAEVAILKAFTRVGAHSASRKSVVGRGATLA
jgi:hypothetical protein